MTWEFIALYKMPGDEGQHEKRGLIEADNVSIAEDKVYDLLPQEAQQIQIYATTG
jgi:hypothetical protein